MTVNDINLTQNTAERSFAHEFAENGLSLYTGFDVASENPHAVHCEVPSRISFISAWRASSPQPHYQSNYSPVNISHV